MKLDFKKARNIIQYYFFFVFGLKKQEIGAFRDLALVLLVCIGIFQIDSYHTDLKKREIIQAILHEPEEPVYQELKKELEQRKKRTKIKAFGRDSSYQRKRAHVININQADSLEWISMPGIGPAFAKRIIGFRERLGGFYSIDQLKEVYGLDSLWVEENSPYLKIGEGIYRKIEVNQADWKGFQHPYIPYKQINLVLNYRKHHGSFNSYEDLKKIQLLDTTLWERGKRYLSFE